MKKYFMESIKIVNSLLIFIIILAFPQTHILSGKITTLVGIILVIAIAPIIYGRFTEIIKGEQRSSFAKIFEKHSLNFYFVSIILGLPIFIFIFSFRGLLAWKTEIVARYAILALINILTIYVLPLVFLKRQNLTTIPLGIRYLLNNFKYSLSLVLLTLLISTIIPLATILMVLFLRDNPFILGTLGFVFYFLSWFVKFIIFVVAGMILTKESALKEQFK
jgi:hypothetical protein